MTVISLVTWRVLTWGLKVAWIEPFSWRISRRKRSKHPKNQRNTLSCWIQRNHHWPRLRDQDSQCQIIRAYMKKDLLGALALISRVKHLEVPLLVIYSKSMVPWFLKLIWPVYPISKSQSSLGFWVSIEPKWRVSSNISRPKELGARYESLLK